MSRRQLRHLPTSGERLRSARESAKLSQEAAARVAEVTLRTYQRWEGDSGEPRGTQVAALALATGKSVNYLLGIDETGKAAA